MKIQRRRSSTIVSSETWSTPKPKSSKPKRETCYLNWFIKTKMSRTKPRAAASTWSALMVVSTYSKVILLSLERWSDRASNPRATTLWISNSSRSQANQARRNCLVEKFSWLIQGIRLCSRSKTVRGRIMVLRCRRFSSQEQLVLSFSSKHKHRETEHLLMRWSWIKDSNKSMVVFHKELNRSECLNHQFRCSRNRSKTVEWIPREERITCFQ